MLDSIFVGMSGLTGFSQGLRVIANNTANLNTPGFKSSSLQFADLFYSTSGGAGGFGDGNRRQVGYGLNTYATTLNFRQGELRQTGNDLDLAVDGEGMFMLQDKGGNISYSRAGQFEFNPDGDLVDRTRGSKVLALNANGALAGVSLAGLRSNPGRATTSVSFSGNLSSTAADKTIDSIKVFDAAGGQHVLSLVLTKGGADGQWSAKVKDGVTEVGVGELSFSEGKVLPDKSKISVTYKPSGQVDMPLTLDFSGEVTSFASDALSTLAPSSVDGYAAGALTKASFDKSGTLQLVYSNGQTVAGGRLALARFDSSDDVASEGDNGFKSLEDKGWHIGAAGEGAFGAVASGSIEISNVDLSQEFSDLVIMQRGYQASSQVISTANEMLQELFTLKGK